MTILDHAHGVPTNCDHPDCRAARRAYVKRWQHDRNHGHLRTTDAQPVRLHLATLLGHGMSLRSVAGQAHVSAALLSRLNRGRQLRIRHTTAAAILAVAPGIAERSYGHCGPFVPRVGTTRRIQALLAIGWTHTALTAQCGHRTGVLLGQRGRWVTRATHDDVARMYRQLCTRPGPSPRSRGWAARFGYLPPVCWDDIDLDAEPDYDPLVHHQADEEPGLDHAAVHRRLHGDRVPLTTAEACEVVRRWVASGRSLNECERLTGLKPDRYLRRQGAAS